MLGAIMPNNVVHFAVHADDCARAKQFYEKVFGWTFQPWGPPGFWLITTGEGGIMGALQQRQAPLSGDGMRGFECTVGVDDVEAIASAVSEHGGTVTAKPFVIETVGTLLQFQDPEGNVLGAMQYLPGALGGA